MTGKTIPVPCFDRQAAHPQVHVPPSSLQEERRGIVETHNGIEPFMAGQIENDLHFPASGRQAGCPTTDT